MHRVRMIIIAIALVAMLAFSVSAKGIAPALLIPTLPFIGRQRQRT